MLLYYNQLWHQFQMVRQLADLGRISLVKLLFIHRPFGCMAMVGRQWIVCICVCFWYSFLDWVASHMCLHACYSIFWAIRCNAENTWEPKRRYYNFCLIFFFRFVFGVFGNAMMIQTSNRYGEHYKEKKDRKDTHTKKKKPRWWKKENKINDISKSREEQKKYINFVWFKKIFYFDSILETHSAQTAA